MMMTFTKFAREFNKFPDFHFAKCNYVCHVIPLYTLGKSQKKVRIARYVIDSIDYTTARFALQESCNNLRSRSVQG